MSNNLQPHIRLSEEDAALYAILPGDPERVDRIGKHLENPKMISYNREYKTISGYYKGVKVLITSTGIGGPSAAIAVEELSRIGVKTLIRVGSCGALQSDIKLGELVIVSGAVRDDGTSKTYIQNSYPAIPDTKTIITMAECANELKFKHHLGIIRSHDSFYTDNEDSIDTYWSKQNVLASDMETASLFVVGSLRNLRTASILNVVVEYNGNLEEGINDYVDEDNASAKGEEREIILALETIVNIDKNK